MRKWIGDEKSEDSGYVSTYGACGDCRSADEKSSVNQRVLPIKDKNGCVFQFPQNGNAETDLPRGIGC